MLGKVVWADALSFVSGQDRTEVAAALHRLARREFLRRVPRSSIPGQTEYAFRHGLIREVAYGRLLRADRARRHQRAAAWLETLGHDRSGDHAELIAYHYQQAVTYLHAIRHSQTDLAGRAAAALRRAGDRAVALAASPAPLRYYTQALELHSPTQPGWADLMLTREVLRIGLENRADIASLTTARDLLLAGGDRGAAAFAEVALCVAAWTGGQATQAAEHQRRARELLREASRSRLAAQPLCELTQQLVRFNRYAEVLTVGRQTQTLARSLELRKMEALSRSAVGLAGVVFGDRAGIGEQWHAIATLEEISSEAVPRVYTALWTAFSHIGDLDGMGEASSGMRRSAAYFGVKASFVWVEVMPLCEQYLLGRWDEAYVATETLIGRLEAAGGHYVEALCYCVRGKIRLARGDVAGALEDSARASGIAEHADEHLLLPAAAFRGSILRAAGTGHDRDTAGRIAASVRDRLAGHLLSSFIGAELPDLLTAYDQVPDIEDKLVQGSPWFQAMVAFRDGRPEDAADIYAGIGDRADEALARLRAGERLAAAGRAEEAAGQLRRARAFYQEVRASRYLDQIAALLTSSGRA